MGYDSLPFGVFKCSQPGHSNPPQEAVFVHGSIALTKLKFATHHTLTIEHFWRTFTCFWQLKNSTFKE